MGSLIISEISGRRDLSMWDSTLNSVAAPNATGGKLPNWIWVGVDILVSSLDKESSEKGMAHRKNWRSFLWLSSRGVLNSL